MVIRPAKDVLRFLFDLVDDEHQPEEQVHINDDSQDYTPGNRLDVDGKSATVFIESLKLH